MEGETGSTAPLETVTGVQVVVVTEKEMDTITDQQEGLELLHRRPGTTLQILEEADTRMKVSNKRENTILPGSKIIVLF